MECWLCEDKGGIAVHQMWSARRGETLWTAHEYPSDDSHPVEPCPRGCASDQEGETRSDRVLRIQRKYHATMMVVWPALSVPGVLWWRESIIFVILVSLYANFATEFGAWHASGAQKEQRENGSS